jgi:small subunit ribosomal protein S6
MTAYEVLYILSPTLEDAARETEIDKYKSIVEKSGGTVEAVDKWGVKKLAYPIQHKSEGYYVLMTVTAGASVPAELERQMRIAEGVVLRFLVVKKDA